MPSRPIRSAGVPAADPGVFMRRRADDVCARGPMRWRPRASSGWSAANRAVGEQYPAGRVRPSWSSSARCGPLVSEMFFDRKLSVGAPFFNMAFTPFMVVLGLACRWGRCCPGSGPRSAGRGQALAIGASCCALAVGLAYADADRAQRAWAVGCFSGAWLIRARVGFVEPGPDGREPSGRLRRCRARTGARPQPMRGLASPWPGSPDDGLGARGYPRGADGEAFECRALP